MADVTPQLTEARAALEAFLAAAEGSVASWEVPRAPGKWSPSQVAEHVARSWESGANAVKGFSSGFPNLPSFLRPIARGLLFRRVLKTGAFPRARTNRAMDPSRGPETVDEARERLTAALKAFDDACRAAAQRQDTIHTGTFGTVALTDYIDFMTIHTRHHRLQLPGA